MSADVREEYRRRAEQYSRRGSVAMLLIAGPVAYGSYAGVFSPLLVVPVALGAGVLMWARTSFRCPACDRTLPRQDPTTQYCPHCEALLRDPTEDPGDPA